MVSLQCRFAWVRHFVLPFAAYAVLMGAGLRLPRHTLQSLFATGTVSILLLLIGIHNSWDAVVYIATERFSNGRWIGPEMIEREAQGLYGLRSHGTAARLRY